jgi:hypothetical protein
MRRSLLALTCAAAAAVALPSTGSAATVQFVQGEQLVTAQRPGTTLAQSMNALLRGPTAAERARQIRSYILPGTKIRSIEVDRGVATIDFSTRLVRGEEPNVLLARLAQVVGTATRAPGVRSVRVRILGGTPLGLFPGIDARRPLTTRTLATPDIAPPIPDSDPDIEPTTSTRGLQQRLADLGYLAPREVDGTAGPLTTAAVIAFQKWQGLQRDGVAGPATLAALQSARRPSPISTGPSGRRIEILIDRQVVLLIENNRVVRTLHASTGTAATPTTLGTFNVYGKFARWWSVPFRQYLPWSVAFVGGIALHEYPDVPVVPASHGCVRLPAGDARTVYDFSSVGMQVKVIGRSR